MFRQRRCIVFGLVMSVEAVFALLYGKKSALSGQANIEFENKTKKMFTSIRNIRLFEGTGRYNLKDKNGNRGDGSWSEYGQGKRVDELLEQRRDGFFVELGGYNGENNGEI
ncbi:hypothetical protein DPMN_034436 [Dreissena polymorpha]|uniref:Uncharacterized protein n=1 Tax=Dreissena polymorpha TaxID=45954 RepID=A0A9D4M931_DREPO|nr:hypothetical protein DPMN_034436 [Dreissena polymorpha]